MKKNLKTMGTELSKFISENNNSVKCFFAVNFHCQQALLEVVHDPKYKGVPLDETDLYNFFYNFFNKPENQRKISDLKRKNILKQDQIALLLPQNQRTISKKWDITLTCVVILNFIDLLPANIKAFVESVRTSRNIQNHSTLKTFSDKAAFEAYFKEIKRILNGLNYSKISKLTDLEGNDIDLTLFENDVALFMDGIKCPKEKEVIMSVLQDWIKRENEKSMFYY